MHQWKTSILELLQIDLSRETSMKEVFGEAPPSGPSTFCQRLSDVFDWYGLGPILIICFPFMAVFIE